MISIDNAQNEIGLAGHIDDGKEWADWLLKKTVTFPQIEEKPTAALQAALYEMLAMSPDEFLSEAEKHSSGDIFDFLMQSGKFAKFDITEPEPQTIPWVSVQDRMPVDDDDYAPLCLVYVSFGSFSRAGYDYWDTDKKQWSEHENDEVTHWCYMDDIPAPATEEKQP